MHVTYLLTYLQYRKPEYRLSSTAYTVSSSSKFPFVYKWFNAIHLATRAASDVLRRFLKVHLLESC